jgi:hypothetical protein
MRKAEGGKLPASFYAMMDKAPESVAEDAKEKATIIAMAEGLAKSGGLKPGQPLFSGYGAGEKIADSVSTVGRPGIVYKAAQLTFPSETAGENVTVPLGKLASPSKATGPERELFAKMGTDGKVEQWIIASPSEVDQAGGKVQRLMRTVLEDGQAKVTPHKQAVAYAAARRELLPDAVKNGDKAPLGMTAQYKEEWLDVVRKSDETRVAEFQAYFDKMWPTVEI